MSFGDRIKQKREERGLTQGQLAELTGYGSRSAIAKVELGLRALPGEKVPLFAAALGVSPGWLMGVEEPESAAESEQLTAGVLKTVFGPELGDRLFEKYRSGSLDRALIAGVLDSGSIKKYLALDAGGRYLADGVIDLETDRMMGAEKYPVFSIPVLALEEGGGPLSVEIPDTEFNRTADLAVIVSGAVLEPEYSDGDILLVRRQPGVMPGETGVFSIGNTRLVGKYYEDRIARRGENFYYSIHGEAECLGKVVGRVRT